MVIICNGAFKSGSTWLFLIIEEILKLKKIIIMKLFIMNGSLLKIQLFYLMMET